MCLEIYQILLLILLGALVGISMSFVGQTGQGVVIPIVFLITEDILLAITVSVLNDLITASAVSIGYLRNKQFKFRKDTFILVIVAIIGSFLGVLILMITPLGNIFSIVIPIFIIGMGLIILKNGFPTTESLKTTVMNLARRIVKKEKYEELQISFEKKLEAQTMADFDEIVGIIPSGSRIFYYLAIGFGFYIGINSGMFGANSGFIITLVLVMLYGYPLKKGVGTALILSIFVCISCFTIYQLLGVTIKGHYYFNIEITLFLAIGSIITGFFASSYIQSLSAKTMGRGMALATISLGLVSLIFYFITK